MLILPSCSAQVMRAELIGTNQCHCPTAGIFVCSYAPVLELCRQLIAANYSSKLRLECFRGATLVLVADPISDAAPLQMRLESIEFLSARNRAALLLCLSCLKRPSGIFLASRRRLHCPKRTKTVGGRR